MSNSLALSFLAWVLQMLLIRLTNKRMWRGRETSHSKVDIFKWLLGTGVNKDNTDRLETKRKKKGESRDLSQQGGVL